MSEATSEELELKLAITDCESAGISFTLPHNELFEDFKEELSELLTAFEIIFHVEADHPLFTRKKDKDTLSSEGHTVH